MEIHKMSKEKISKTGTTNKFKKRPKKSKRYHGLTNKELEKTRVYQWVMSVEPLCPWPKRERHKWVKNYYLLNGDFPME
jgi:hypothetical protein